MQFSVRIHNSTEEISVNKSDKYDKACLCTGDIVDPNTGYYHYSVEAKTKEKALFKAFKKHMNIWIQEIADRVKLSEEVGI